MRSILAAAFVVFWLPATPASPAPSGLTQTVAVAAQLPRLSSQWAEVCLNEECWTISLPDGPATPNELRLSLTYTLADRARLPGIDGAAPLPAACELTNPDGSVRRRAGAAVLASGARFTERSFVEVLRGRQSVATLTPSRKPTRTDAVSASICLLGSPAA